MPFRPRRGWGWPTLRSPGTNSRQQLCPKADSSRSLATVFSSQLGYRLYVVPLLQTAAPEKIKPRPQGSVGFEKSVRKAKRWSIRPPSLYGVHYVPQARSPDQRLKRRKPSPLKEGPISPFRNLFRTRELVKKSLQLAKPKWRRNKKGF